MCIFKSNIKKNAVLCRMHVRMYICMYTCMLYLTISCDNYAKLYSSIIIGQ